MDKYTNKNSLSSVISSFTESLEKWVIDPNEALASKPSNFVNMVSSTIGKLNAYGYYDMLASKNEVNQSTAIRMKSLLRHLRSDMIKDIYGTPSSIIFILSFPEQLLIKHAVPFSYGISKLTLNKNAKITIPNKPQFTIDNNIDIFVNKYDNNNDVKYSIYAMYDTTSLENGELFKVINPFINSRNDMIIDGQRYFTMYIPIKQYTRDSEIYELSGENKDINFTYENQLVGFVVLYKGPSDQKWRLVNTYLEGTNNSDGLSYSITDINSVKILTLKYSKVPGGFSPINGTLKLNVFTTLGKGGNFNIPKEGLESDESLAGLLMAMEQDTSDIYQEALTTLIPTGSLFNLSAEGGRDALSLEEVRRLVINRAMSLIITPSGLSQAAAESGFSDSKPRHDLLEWRYKLSKSLQDNKGNIVPSRTIDITFLYSEIENFVDSNSRIIAPYDNFRYDELEREYKHTPLVLQDTTYVDYLEKYKSGLGNDYLFPYFLRIQNGQNIDIEPYDLSINESRIAEFVYITENILDKTSVMRVDFTRNPLDTEKVVIRNSNNILGNFYEVRFVVYTSSAIIDHLKSLNKNEDPFVKFKVIIKNKTDGVRYALDIDPSHYVFDSKDNTIQCTGYLETNNSILKNGKICAINNSLAKIPFSLASYPFYFIDGEIDSEIVVIYKDINGVSNTSEYDMYLTGIEITNHYYIGVIYKVDNIVFAKNMKDYVHVDPDIRLTQPKYKMADKDISDVYDEIVYKMDDGKYVIEEDTIKLADGTYQKIEKYVVLHNKGDIKKELDGRIGTFDITTNNSIWSNEENNEGIYNTGDILGGNPIYASVKTNNGLIIFGGKEGRIGCYDVEKNIMYPYNTPINYRDDNRQLVIKSDGSPLAHKDIRTMLIIQVVDTYHNNALVDILVIAGENGLVASLNITTGVWCYCDGSKGDALANIYNNGSGMGASSIYCSTLYENQNPEKNTIIFAGGDGRICCYNIASRIWYNYDSTYSGEGVITNDGRAMGYKAILTMVNYLNSILFLAGILGHISTCDIATRQFSHFDAGTGIHSTGEVIGGGSIYASTVINAIYVVAGENGRVASYDIAKSLWTSYEQRGFASTGAIVAGENINAIEPYDNYVIFGSDNGLVASYNIFTNDWTPYNAPNGIRNNGNFIKNSISTIIKYNTIIYFTGKAGNVIYKYRKGDILLDENNKLIVEKPSELQGVIRSLPAYNRIYGIKSSFFSILKSYNDMIKEISSLSLRYPYGCKLTLGIKNTSGESRTFKFTNTKTKVEQYLDSLNITLSLGVKFKDNVFDDDKPYLVDQIITEIQEYVKEIQVTNGEGIIRLNFTTMLDTIKDRVPNILYFELYTVNNYDATVCQTIFWKKEIEDINNTNQSIFDEYLSIRNDVDEDKSDIANQMVVFKPSIYIVVL